MDAGATSPAERLRTYKALGVRNLARIGAYRGLCAAGYYRRILPPGDFQTGPMFDWPKAAPSGSFPVSADVAAHVAEAEAVLRGDVHMFADEQVNLGFPPNWHRNAMTGVTIENTAHWTQVGEFSLGGDVKGFWDVSRLDGLLQLTLGWLCSGDARFAQGAEQLLASWCRENPPNTGVNWRCGQETALRLLTVLLAAELLERWGGVHPTNILVDFVEWHLQRITPTMLYAVSQDNNHATSEAAALFAGGCWLNSHAGPKTEQLAVRFQTTGRSVLEERVKRLVMNDGSFAQHSVVYHRMLVDSLWITEVFLRWYVADAFSPEYYARFGKAVAWLDAFVDLESFDAPNLGANDGTQLFRLAALPYRDFRPPLLAGAAVLGLDTHVKPGSADEALDWLGVRRPGEAPADVRDTVEFRAGGYVRLSAGGSRAFLRLPVFAFRPGQCDALHVDLWRDGRAVLRDGGSFSYNSTSEDLDYFAGTASHNTVQFDSRDQMPRLSRFLVASWLRMDGYHVEVGRASAGYTDSQGASHHRTVEMSERTMVVDDSVGGDFDTAVLRWRLDPQRTWTLNASGCTDGEIRIDVQGTGLPGAARLTSGWESLTYGRKSELPVLEFDLSAAQTVRTTVSW